jgi:hypothetical protein
MREFYADQEIDKDEEPITLRIISSTQSPNESPTNNNI